MTYMESEKKCIDNLIYKAEIETQTERTNQAGKTDGMNWGFGNPQDWKRPVFTPIPKKGNAKECSNYHTIALISHTHT